MRPSITTPDRVELSPPSQKKKNRQNWNIKEFELNMSTDSKTQVETRYGPSILVITLFNFEKLGIIVPK